jgi:hypothetical protein
MSGEIVESVPRTLSILGIIERAFVSSRVRELLQFVVVALELKVGLVDTSGTKQLIP